MPIRRRPDDGNRFRLDKRRQIGDSIRKTNNVMVVEQGTQGTAYGNTIADEIQRRFFDYLDQPVKRLIGGEGAPTISKSLDMAAHVGPDEVRVGYGEILADSGRTLPQAAE